MSSPAATGDEDRPQKGAASTDRRMLSSLAELVPFDKPSVDTQIMYLTRLNRKLEGY